MKYVLQLHKGPIHRFAFSAPLEKRYWAVLDHWILNIRRRMVREIIIDLVDPRYKMPHNLHPALFSCKTLSTLSLQCCTLRLPDGFRGLPNLTHLNLKDVTIEGLNALSYLLSHCPLLEHLTLEIWSNMTGLKVVAPNLCTLNMELRGFFKSICLYTPKLPSLIMALVFDQANHEDPEGRSTGCNLNNLLEKCVNVKELVIRSTLEFMCVGDAPLNFPSTFNYLKQLEICLNIDCWAQVLAALCLLDRCPVLNSLLVNSSRFSCGSDVHSASILEEQNLQDCKLDHLKHVDFKWMKGSEDEMVFVKLVLGKAPSVSKLSIQMDGDHWSIHSNSTWLQELISLKRHLTRATMHFEGEIILDGSSVSSIKTKILKDQYLKMCKMGFCSAEQH